MQRIDIIGHLGQDAEVKDFQNTQVINFSVAVSESYTNSQGEKVTTTNWFECAKWGNNVSVAQFLKKGTQVFVTGKPQSRAWQKEDGTLVSNMGINVFNLQLLGSKESNGQNSNQTIPQAQQSNSFVDEPKGVMPEEDDSDLPF